MTARPSRPAVPGFVFAAALALGAVLATSLVLVPHARAGGGNCMDCHDGAVSPPALAASAHGGLAPGKEGQSGAPGAACAPCHGAIAATEEGHPKPAPVDCGRCHASARDQLASSSHRAVAGPPSAKCKECHGTHEVKKISRMPIAERRQLEKDACGRCHADAWSLYEKSFHGRSRSAGVATCTDCHGGHAILSRRDPAASTYKLKQAETCAACHMNAKRGFTQKQIQMVDDYFSSAHGLAVRRSGLLLSATCVDCHGAHSIVEAASRASAVSRAHIPETCGKCHAGVLKSYQASVHGKPLKQGNTDVPVCIDCHKSHQIRSHWDPKSTIYSTNISTTCLKCHSNAKIINRYSFAPLREETYLESYHGAASKLGDTNVANCGSCHGFHDILRSNDPRSSVSPANMGRTCGKCHKASDPSKPMAVGKIHLTTAKESHWVVDLVKTGYIAILAGTLGLFVVLIALDLSWQVRSRRRKKVSPPRGAPPA
jgi:hypothetical protein